VIGPTAITLDEALRAMASQQHDPRYAVWLKSEPARLANPDSAEYQALFTAALPGATLIEQSIGRGLRLPYGKCTGVAAVDRLNIVAHDKFQEIIDEANRGDSPIRLKQVILDSPSDDDKKVSVQVGSGVMTRLGLTDAPAISGEPSHPFGSAPAPVFTSERERQVAQVVMEVIGHYEVKRDLVPTSEALLRPEVQSAILSEVTERLKPLQSDWLTEVDARAPALDLLGVVAKTTAIVVQQTIDIPRIAVVPTGEVTTGFHPFTLDVSQMRLQPGEREILIHNLHTNAQETLASEGGGSWSSGWRTTLSMRWSISMTSTTSRTPTCFTISLAKWSSTCKAICPRQRSEGCWIVIVA
jgi:hypothetical protein